MFSCACNRNLSKCLHLDFCSCNIFMPVPLNFPADDGRRFVIFLMECSKTMLCHLNETLQKEDPHWPLAEIIEWCYNNWLPCALASCHMAHHMLMLLVSCRDSFCLPVKRIELVDRAIYIYIFELNY